MPKKSTENDRRRKEQRLDAKLDTVIRLLEDIFTLQALISRVGTNRIQKILGIRKARISKIAVGTKEARKKTLKEGL
jgi:hypothetical protein